MSILFVSVKEFTGAEKWKNEMDATINFKIITKSDVYNDYGMRALNKRLAETCGEITLIEDSERSEFGETIKYKIVTIEKKSSVKLENINTKGRALTKFNSLHNNSTMGGKMSEFSVTFSGSNKKSDAFIVDAEEMLLEMDANNVDELILKEGFSGRTKITRTQVLKQIGLSGHTV